MIAFGRASLRQIEQQTLFNAINAYAAVLRDRAGVGIARDNVAVLDREFRDNRERQRLREATSTDVQQVESRLELARAQLLAAQRAAGSRDAAFLRFVGAPAGELAAPNPLQVPARTLEDAYLYADAHNPVIASAYARERTSRAELEGARADLLPRIDLQGSARYGSVTPYSDAVRQTELRGGITVTGTLDSGIREARIGEAAEANDADWRLIDAALRDNRAELADAWNEWQSQTASIERLRAAVAAAQQALEGALIQERAGLRTTLDVLDLARDLLVVRSSYNEATAAAFVAQARVLAAMGALDQEYLLPDAPRYSPEAHLEKVGHRGDLPLLTPLVRAIDSVTTPKRSDRQVRDPAAQVAVESAPND
jgi:outer membrane protein